MNRVTRQDTCLMFSGGEHELDTNELELLQTVCGRHLRVLYVKPRSMGGYDLKVLSYYRQETGEVIDTGFAADVPAIVIVARNLQVTWVAPTTHGHRTMELAEVAQQLSLLYPSPEAVRSVEDKLLCSQILEQAGLHVPPMVLCKTKKEIKDAITAFDNPCVMKLRDGVSSVGYRVMDRQQLTDRELNHLIDWHLAQREAHHSHETLIQEYLGSTEYGFGGLIRSGPEFAWSITTRKDTVRPPFARLVRHAYDPADKKRLAATERLILPTMTTAIKALDAWTRKTNGRQKEGLPNCPINADILISGNKAWIVDISYRWAPRFHRMANATLGRSCQSPYFVALAVDWAKGTPVKPSAFRPIGPARAVILQKAFIEGGMLIQRHPTKPIPEAGIFHSEYPSPGTVLSGLDDIPRQHGAGGYPLISAEGATLSEAQTNWRRAIHNLGLVVQRDNIVRGYAPDRMWGYRVRD